MKKIILVFLGIIFRVVPFAQTFTSSCSYTSLQEKIFKADAVKLSVLRMQEINHPYKDSIDVYQPIYDSMLKALVAINNMQASPLKDTLNNLFAFQDFSTLNQYEIDSSHINSARLISNFYASIQSVKGITVYASQTVDWAISWGSGNFNNTPNAAVNYVVNKYNLSVTVSPYIIAGKYTFTVSAPTSINTNGLSYWFNNMLGSVPNTVDAGVLNNMGDGNTISYEVLSDGIRLNYRNGCGDCPAGCTWGTTWMMKILPECSVTKLGATYTPLYFNPATACLRNWEANPVVFSNFYVTEQNKRNAISWKVSTEYNMDKYWVMKSADGINFYPIAQVTSLNKSGSEYTVLDDKTNEATIYYQIKSQEKTGEIHYSKMVVLKQTILKDAINIYPNPVLNNRFNVEYKSLSIGRYSLELLTTEGKSVSNFSFVLNQNNGIESFFVPKSITKGNYLIVIKNEQGNLLQRIITIL